MVKFFLPRHISPLCFLETFTFKFPQITLIKIRALYIVSGVDVLNCHAKYGAVDALVTDLQRYANAHISRSFDYLLMVCILQCVCSCI